MKPNPEDLITYLSEIDKEIIEDHLERLGEDYFEKFQSEDVIAHIRFVSRLTSSNPVETLIARRRDDYIDCTIIAFDYPAEFSLITGLLFCTGFNIVSGDVYTYERKTDSVKRTGVEDQRVAVSSARSDRRKIVDVFFGYLTGAVSFEDWRLDFNKMLYSIISLLETGSEDSIIKAKNRVNEMVVGQLARIKKNKEPVLYPVELSVDNNTGPFTRLKVVSQDTPAFMYALSNALALNKIQIEHVRIRTFYGRVEDRIDMTDSKGKRIVEQNAIERVKFSVLLTKQFTYFLSNAPDPFAALSRFEIIVRDIVEQPYRQEWVKYLTNSANLTDLAKLLGTSEFLWEDFIRLQYESLLTVFNKGEKQTYSRSLHEMDRELEMTLAETQTLEDRKAAINRFKDKEIFLIDLDHILNPELGLRYLSEKLTGLAELIVKRAAQSVYSDLVAKYGKPCSVAGMNVRYSILGLGKLGGEALGYASDIELLVVYSDNGNTDGDKIINNSEFFNLFVKELFQFIETKREGIFQIDLRLRPYGESGPLASSMESFCNYYGRGGKAHAYEILSLVRMRHIGGDIDLGKRLERIRDEIVYLSNAIDFKALTDLRERQFREKSLPETINAKYSPGGLVDLEYGIQSLQVMYGKSRAEIRTPRVHEALAALKNYEVINDEDYLHLIDAYDFLRRLINGLRMLRGNALDLFLPEENTGEFNHLARRMGYTSEGPITPSQKLLLDLETCMAGVRYFKEKYFGIESIPSLESSTIVDVVLSENMPLNVRNSILERGGIRDAEKAYVNLKHLSGKGSRRDVFSRLIILAWDILKRTPDPDMALNNWERFIHAAVSPEFHYNILMSQPMQLEILLGIFSSSQFLADTLIRNPGFFEWLINPEFLNHARKREDLESELKIEAGASSTEREWLNRLRRFRRREILRIGTCDICLGIPTRTIMQELSDLADAITSVALEQRLRGNFSGQNMFEKSPDKTPFCIMAFGKLGGNELNYSSDIDLIGLFSTEEGDGSFNDYDENRAIFTRIMEQVCSDLSSHTEEGYVYRVDLRLRPFGSSGDLIHSLKGISQYYIKTASLWEIQAAMKLRPIAGNTRLGYKLIENLKPLFFKKRDQRVIFGEIEKMRKAGIRSSSCSSNNAIDIKSGIGGIRDVEFLVQGLQLLNGRNNRNIISGNTILGLENLAEAGIITEDASYSLREDYIFLRRTEHYLQILEDRQIHTLPKDKREIDALAKRMLGVDAGSDQFLDLLNACLRRIRDAYEKYVLLN